MNMHLSDPLAKETALEMIKVGLFLCGMSLEMDEMAQHYLTFVLETKYSARFC
jgi:hypothetical protein